MTETCNLPDPVDGWLRESKFILVIYWWTTESFPSQTVNAELDSDACMYGM